MKYFSFTLILMLFLFNGVNSFAQESNPTRKGRLLADSDFSYNSADSKTSNHALFSDDLNIDHNQFSIDLSVGYTIIDNLYLGLRLFNLNESTTTETPHTDGTPGVASTSTEETTNLFFGPSIRYYFLDKNFKPFLGVTGGLSQMNVTSVDGDGVTFDQTGNGIGYNFEVGFAYFVNDHIGLELLYRNHNENHDVDGTVSGTGFEIPFTAEDNVNASIISIGFIVGF